MTKSFDSTYDDDKDELTTGQEDQSKDHEERRKLEKTWAMAMAIGNGAEWQHTWADLLARSAHKRKFSV
jgi:hypothetical protein